MFQPTTADPESDSNPGLVRISAACAAKLLARKKNIAANAAILIFKILDKYAMNVRRKKAC